MEVIATLTEVRTDGMQKWEDNQFPAKDSRRYIWINAYQSAKGVEVGSKATLVFTKSTGGLIGGHWAGWKVKEII